VVSADTTTIVASTNLDNISVSVTAIIGAESRIIISNYPAYPVKNQSFDSIRGVQRDWEAMFQLL